MSVIPVTVFFSLGLVGFFIVLFLREQRRRVFASAERDSLLPLADEQPRVVGHDQPVPHDHPHDDASCGCARGERAMCAHCRQRPGHIV